MESELIKIFEQFGTAAGMGAILFIVLKCYISQALQQNKELVDYLMKSNTQLLETNREISEQTRKALEELVEEIKKRL